jgi:hypothetical protein
MKLNAAHANAVDRQIGIFRNIMTSTTSHWLHRSQKA